MNPEISRRAVLAGAGALAPAAPLAGSINVRDFMAQPLLADLDAERPSMDASAAFKAAWQLVSERGGNLVIPPGNYFLAEPWRCEIAQPVNIRLSGWGAKLFTGPEVTGAAIEIRGAFNEYLLDIEGLAFDHRGNGRAGGCFEILGGHCVSIRRCTLEYSAVRAGYRFIVFAALPGGQRAKESRDDRNSLWCKVEGCTIRRRSGSEPGMAACFVQAIGAANALTIVDNCIQHCAIGVAFEPDPETGSLANAAVIERNFFETVDRAGISVTIAEGHYGPTGLRILHNRFERCPAALEVLGGAEARIHSQPPFLFGNYYTAGSVDAAVSNPGGYPISSLETRYPGFGPKIDNVLYMSGGLGLRFAKGEDLRLGGYDGTANWDRGRLSFGGQWKMWIDPGNGRAYLRRGEPASAADGALLGDGR